MFKENKELQLNDNVHFRGHFRSISYIASFKIKLLVKIKITKLS